MSAHFELAEFLASDTARYCGIDNFPTWDAVDNLARLADTMARVRRLLGDWPVLISSGYRCPDLNAAVGGADNSAHLYGLAADFTVPDFGSSHEVCLALEPYIVALDIDQLIDESPPDGWVHLGLAANGCIPRNECFAIT